MQNRMMSGHKQYMSAIRKKAYASALILRFTSEVFLGANKMLKPDFL